MPDHAPAPASELLELLTLERLEDNLFRGQSRDIGTKYVFGGQVLGQALSAAQCTLEQPRGAHSLHAYFLRAGDIEHPIVYDVDRTRDGGSFSVRRVTAIQHGKVVFFCAASFQDIEDSAEHQLSKPEVPQPEDLDPAPAIPDRVLATLPTKIQRWLDRSGPFEFRHVYPRDELNPPKRPPTSRSGSGWRNRSAMRRSCIVHCWPTPRISTCSARQPSPTASATTSRTCRWRRLTMRSGSIAPSASTTGCCIQSTAPAPRVRVGWRAA